jgi:nucleoside-diphosphate-sugar epimerase
MADGVVLITGAGGYLGGRLARHYLDTTDAELVLPVRTNARRIEIESALAAGSRVAFVCADLEADDPFAGVEDEQRKRITGVVHAAAVTRFNVDRDLARKVNIEGTAAVLALARRCPGLESLAHLSTVYATGLHEGVIREVPADDDAGFANAYEWSKWASEALVVEADDLPWRILRVCTVIADDETGAVTQYNAFHETLKLCFYGLLSLLPGRGDTPIYLVPGGFAVDAVAQLAGPNGGAGIYHVSTDRAGALTLDDLLSIVFEQFRAVEDFRKKRIMRPLLADRESFELMVDGVSPMAGSLVSQALQNVAPFARQLYVNKVLDNSRLRDALGSNAPPDVTALVTETCRQLVRTRWGRRSAEA